jgi:hypothetical protein
VRTRAHNSWCPGGLGVVTTRVYLDDYLNGMPDKRSMISQAPAVHGGDGFTFDPVELVSVLDEWQRLKEELIEDARYVEQLAAVQGPGKEPASEGMAAKAVGSGNALREHHTSMLTFVQRYIDNLTRARNDYLAQDMSGRAAFGR